MTTKQERGRGKFTDGFDFGSETHFGSGSGSTSVHSDKFWEAPEPLSGSEKHPAPAPALLPALDPDPDPPPAPLSTKYFDCSGCHSIPGKVPHSGRFGSGSGPASTQLMMFGKISSQKQNTQSNSGLHD